jgi:excisionase family DNA binding protein
MELRSDDGRPFGDELEPLLTVQELALRLHVPASWIYERTRRRGVARLPFIRLGKYVRFEVKAVQAYLSKQRNNA